MKKLWPIKFEDRHFIRGEHYYPGLKFTIRYKYNDEEDYLQPDNSSDGYFYLYTSTPNDKNCKPDAPLVWFIKPEY